MINFTPDPILFALGPIEIRWYGIAYIAAIMAGYWLARREARRRGERDEIIVDSLIIIAVAALLGGRAYHVIDQWAYYKDHLSAIFLPPYSGLGIYGGLFTGMLAAWALARHHKVSFWRWGDIIVPAVLLAQVVGRWGNFMNQELYGPPTNLPWGIAIDCAHRVAPYFCPAQGGTTPADAHFIPLFFYESMLSLLGVFTLLWLWNHFTARGRILIAGDVGLIYFVWYGIERTVLETFRGGWDWVFPMKVDLPYVRVEILNQPLDLPFGQVFQNPPMAQIVGMGAAAAAIVAILIRHWWVRRHPLESGSGPAGGEPEEQAVAASEPVAPPEPTPAD